MALTSRLRFALATGNLFPRYVSELQYGNTVTVTRYELRAQDHRTEVRYREKHFLQLSDPGFHPTWQRGPERKSEKATKMPSLTLTQFWTHLAQAVRG